MRILFDGEPINLELFDTRKENSSEKSEPIFCISPYLATTTQVPFKSTLWLDTNVMLRTSATNVKPNIQELLKWANERGMAINLDLAIWELSRSQPIEECVARVNECTKALRIKFGLNISQELWVEQARYRYKNKEISDKYIDEQACYIIIIKYFYHQSGTFEEKCESFAHFIESYLPFFRMTYLTGILYLFAKQKGFLFEKKVKAKWQSDMDKSQSQLHWIKAKNAASDVAITTFVTLAPLIRGTGILQIPYIGTSDQGLAGFLSELGYNGIYINEGIYPVGNGSVGYREGSIARTENISSIANRLSDKFSFGRNLNDEDKSVRLRNLSELSGIILEKNFDIGLAELKNLLAIKM